METLWYSSNNNIRCIETPNGFIINGFYYDKDFNLIPYVHVPYVFATSPMEQTRDYCSFYLTIRKGTSYQRLYSLQIPLIQKIGDDEYISFSSSKAIYYEEKNNSLTIKSTYTSPYMSTMVGAYRVVYYNKALISERYGNTLQIIDKVTGVAQTSSAINLSPSNTSPLNLVYRIGDVNYYTVIAGKYYTCYYIGNDNITHAWTNLFELTATSAVLYMASPALLKNEDGKCTQYFYSLYDTNPGEGLMKVDIDFTQSPIKTTVKKIDIVWNDIVKEISVYGKNSENVHLYHFFTKVGDKTYLNVMVYYAIKYVSLDPYKHQGIYTFLLEENDGVEKATLVNYNNFYITQVAYAMYYDDGKTIITGTESDLFDVWEFSDGKQGFVKTNKEPIAADTIGFDTTGRVLYIDSVTGNLHMYVPEENNKIYISYEKEYYQYIDTPIQTYVQGEVTDYLGNPIEKSFKLTLSGNCKFSENNLKELTVISTGGKFKALVTITGPSSIKTSVEKI